MRCLSKRTREFGTRSLVRPSVVLISRIILFFQLLASRKRRFCCSEDDPCNPASRERSPDEGTCLVIALNAKVRRHRQRGRVVFLEWRGTEKQDGVGRGEERCDRAKALGSNSLKCPVVRKKPLRVKNSLPWCVGARSLDTVCVSTPAVVWSIAFRSRSFSFSGLY